MGDGMTDFAEVVTVNTSEDYNLLSFVVFLLSHFCIAFLFCVVRLLSSTYFRGVLRLRHTHTHGITLKLVTVTATAWLV